MRLSTLDEDPAGRREEVTAPRAARLAAYVRGGGVIVPILTALIAFFVGGLVVLLTGHNPFSTYKAIFNGTGLQLAVPVDHRRPTGTIGGVQPAADADRHDAADPRRPGGGVRVPRRPVQHRRPGPVHRSARSPRSGSAPRSRACRRCCTSCSRSSPRRWPARAWAGIAGVLKAALGANEVISTIMLNWIAIWVGVCLFGLGGPLQNPHQQSVPVSNDVVSSAQAAGVLGQPGAAGPAHRPVHRARRRGRVLGDPQPHHGSATRSARSASTRMPRATAGSTSASNYFIVMAICGVFAGLGGARSTCSAGSSASPPTTSRRRRRLPRHRGRAARAQHRGRRGVRCAAVRRADDRHLRALPRPERVRPEAGVEPHADDPGPDRAARLDRPDRAAAPESRARDPRALQTRRRSREEATA